MHEMTSTLFIGLSSSAHRSTCVRRTADYSSMRLISNRVSMELFFLHGLIVFKRAYCRYYELRWSNLKILAVILEGDPPRMQVGLSGEGDKLKG